jgi:hypothetical protein
MAVLYDVKEQLQRAERASCLYPVIILFLLLFLQLQLQLS